MNNENFLDEYYSELKKKFSLGKTIADYGRVYQSC